MKFAGKQIRIKFLDGDLKVYRGSAYSLVVNTYSDYSWVEVFLNGEYFANFPSASIESVDECGFSAETLS